MSEGRPDQAEAENEAEEQDGFHGRQPHVLAPCLSCDRIWRLSLAEMVAMSFLVGRIDSQPSQALPVVWSHPLTQIAINVSVRKLANFFIGLGPVAKVLQ